MATGGTQKLEIENLMKTPLKIGDSWFLLDTSWFKGWKKYVGYDPWDIGNAGDQTYHPGPIDNSALFTGSTMGDVNGTCSTQLKKGLKDELDYMLVPEQAWIMMVDWYGLSPDQVIILVQKNTDGTWPRAGHGMLHNYSQRPKKGNTERVTTAEGTDLQCVVCHELYSHPKRLTCHHLVCAKCVLAWLQEGGRGRGCPLCRAPILNPTPSPGCNMAALVAQLPTDLGMAARLEKQQALQRPRVCGMCPGTAASSYCLQCCLTLCDVCTTYHHKLPGTSGHTVENLSQLTAKKPPAPILPLPMCPSHGDHSVELFCSSHQALLCKQCSSAHHADCKGVRPVTEAARDKRTEFEQHCQTLGQKAADASKQVQALTDTHLQAQKVFDSLQECLKRRRQEVSHQIQTSERQVDEARAAIVLHNAVLDNLVHSADDHTLLTSLTKLDSAVTAIQQHTEKVPEVPHKPAMTFGSQAQDQILTAIDSLGNGMGLVIEIYPEELNFFSIIGK